MNKSAEFFCKQNPKFYLICNNPHCKKKHSFKSKDVFKNQSFEFKCESCGDTTTFERDPFIKDFETQLKKIGVRLG